MNIGYSQLVADFSASDSSGCLPLPVQLRDLSTGNPDKWLWDFGDGRTSPLKNPSLLYLLPGSYTITLTIYKGQTESATVTKQAFINVYNYPEVDFSSNIVEGCIPLPVSFRNLSKPGSGTIASSIWDFGDGSTGSGINPNHTYGVTGRYNVSLKVANSFGCQRSVTVPNMVRIFDSVRAKFSYIPQSACGAPFPVNFFDETVGNGLLDRTWYFGDGSSSNEINPLHVYNAPGNYKIKLVVKNAFGCKDSVTRDLNIVVGNFQSSFTAPAQICRGPRATFTNTSTPVNQLDSVLWDFGDGTVSKVLSPTKGFNTPGTYKVTLTSYFNSCRIISTRDIVVLPGPTTDFTADPTAACTPPLIVNFTNLTSNGTVFRWNLGNGQTPGAGINTPTTTYTQIGNYTVTLITRNANGCNDTLVKPNFIKVQPLRIMAVEGLPFQGCFPYSPTFRPSVQTNTPVEKWEWDFGDGRTSTEQFPKITFTKPGVYPVKLKITTANGCTDSIISTVRGGNKPVVTFSAFPLTVCPSDPVSFEGNVQGKFDSLRWTFGDGGTAFNTLTPNYMYRDTGFMDVTLYAYDNGCMDSLIIERYVYVSPPLANFGVSLNCANQFQRQFSDSSVGATSWLWKFGNGDESTAQNPWYTYPKPGSYTVSLTVSDGKCKHEKSMNILVLDEVPDFVLEQIPSCIDNITTFRAQGPKLNLNNIDTISWAFSGIGSFINAGPTFTHTFKVNTNLNARLVIIDKNGCRKNTLKNINITIGGPKARILPRQRLVCLNNKVVFEDSSQINLGSPIVKWTWNFGNGTIKTYTAPPFENVYTDTGFYNLKLLVEDINGCVDSISVPKAVGVFSPMVDFISPDTIVCPNTDVNFINKSTGVGLKYLWTLGEGDNSTLKDPIKKFANKGFYDIGLTVTDTANCVTTLNRPRYIEVGGARAIFEVSDSFASCPPLRVNFSNSSIGAISYSWDFGNGNTSILQDPVQTYSEIGSFYASLVIIGNGGCTDTMTKQIQIRGPQGSISYSPLSGCPPLTVNFSSNTSNVKTYIWDFSDGVTDFTSDSTITHTYLNPGTFRPRVILADGQDCQIPIIGTSDIKVVGVRSLIKELTNYTYCDSVTIFFSDSSIANDEIKRWNWDFGDGDSSNLQNPTHTYKKPGRFKVSLFVETKDGCSSVSNLPAEIVISASPKISFNNDTTFCLPGQVLFRADRVLQDTTTLSWLWDFDNGITSTLSQPDSILYDKKGVYRPTVNVIDNYGCVATNSAVITVNESALVYVVDLENYQFCNSGTVSFKDSSVNANIVRGWRWDFGDGNFSNERNPTHTYNQIGRFQVTLNVETDRSCVTQSILPGAIVVAPSPQISIGSDTSFCLPGKVVFKGEWLNADTTQISWLWNFGNGQMSNLQNPDTVTFNNTGTYEVKLINENNYGCKDSTIRLVQVNDKPNIIFGRISPMVICDSGRVSFNHDIVSNDPITSWLWTFGDGGISTEEKPTYKYNIPGRYKISLSVNTSFNCTSEGDYPGEIIVAASPVISIPADTTFCIPQGVSFLGSRVNTDTTQLNWVWNFGNGQTGSGINPGSIFYRTPGTFNAVAIATDNYGCSDSSIRQIVAKDTPRLVITGPDLTCRGSSVQLMARGAEQISWNPDPTLSCTSCNNPVARPTNNQVYVVNGSNGLGAGCARSKEILIRVLQPLNISATRGDTICIGESSQLIATGGDRYLWSPAIGLSAINIPNPIARPQQTTIYRLVVSDSVNCFSDTLYVPIVVYPKPTIKILEDKISGLVGTSAIIRTEATNVTRWRWTPATGLSCVNCPEPVVQITQPISYRLSATNLGGCIATDDIEIEPYCNADGIFVPNTFSPNGDGRNDIFFPMGRGVSAIKSFRVFNRWGEMVFERSNLFANDPTAGWDGTFKGRTLSPDVYVYILVVLCYNNEILELKGNVTLLK